MLGADGLREKLVQNPELDDFTAYVTGFCCCRAIVAAAVNCDGRSLCCTAMPNHFYLFVAVCIFQHISSVTS